MMPKFLPGDPRAIQAGKQGGAIRARQRKRESIQKWTTKYPGVTPEAAIEIYEQGYRSGWQSGLKSQRRQGKGLEATT